MSLLRAILSYNYKKKIEMKINTKKTNGQKLSLVETFRYVSFVRKSRRTNSYLKFF